MNDHVQTNHIMLGNNPALLMVNMTKGFTQNNSPLHNACSATIEANQRLLSVFRLSAIPIAFTSLMFTDKSESSVLRNKQPELNILTPLSEWVLLDERLNRLEEEPIFEQSGPSAFFDTELAAWLVMNDIDSLVICGLTTSGCIRASVLDCIHNNYPVWVAEDACFDKDTEAHNSNLRDIANKYAGVKTVDEIIDLLAPTNDLSESDYI